VTDGRRAIARLVPIRTSLWDELVDNGRIWQGEDDADVADEAPADYGVATSRALARMRADER